MLEISKETRVGATQIVPCGTSSGLVAAPWSTLRAEGASRPMKLYGFPPTRSIRVLWTLRELDVEFEFINVDPTKGELRSPEFLAVNPAGKLPALVDGDFILTESV